MGKIEVFENAPVMKFSQEKIVEIGRAVVQEMDRRGQLNKLAEKLGVSKEDLTMSGNTALYTTAIASFVEKRMRPDLLAQKVIKKITDFSMKGFNSVKIPLRDALITASDLPDTGTLTYDSNSYGSQTVTLGWKYAANKLTHELLQHAAIDLIAEELGEIGDALARKADSDIISTVDAACTAGNGNLTSLGAGNYVTYDALVDALVSAMDNYAKPNVILTNPSDYGRIAKLSQVTTAVGNVISRDEGIILPAPQAILNMQILVSQQVSAETIYLIDTTKLGYFVVGSDVQTFDGRVSGTLAYEVIGAMAYGVGIVQPKAIYKIEENA